MSWKNFIENTFVFPEVGVSVDISRLAIPDTFLQEMNQSLQKAFTAMDALEKGAIANPDEKRMVGHYWLRNAALAPEEGLTKDIQDTRKRILAFAASVHDGSLKGGGGTFTDLLVIGIGGSALGPQFVAQALGHPKKDKVRVHFFDNTDPDGMDLTLAALDERLGRTLAIVISKSGGTPETRNGMVEAKIAYERAGLDFAKHAVAITGEGSKLDKIAEEAGWLARFPMWDWVGGRTSELGPVGLVPAAIQGIDVEAILAGASLMDTATRFPERAKNPAALLALAWYFATDGTGAKDMVILPYKDRLLLFSRYLQQLIMESLGKEYDLDGKVVNQGIAVYGNKGSTDQHAYVQQLREGVNNFFVTFIEVLRDRSSPAVEIEPGFTSGDYLQGFLLGTRDALSEKGRGSITITIPEVTPKTVGMLIALYERAVGLYASLININAYHQPGVEAGKKAASSVLALNADVRAKLLEARGKAFTAEEMATALDATDQTERIYKLLEHLAANGEKGVQKTAADPWFEATFKIP